MSEPEPHPFTSEPASDEPRVLTTDEREALWTAVQTLRNQLALHRAASTQPRLSTVMAWLGAGYLTGHALAYLLGAVRAPARSLAAVRAARPLHLVPWFVRGGTVLGIGHLSWQLAMAERDYVFPGEAEQLRLYTQRRGIPLPGSLPDYVPAMPPT